MRRILARVEGRAAIAYSHDSAAGHNHGYATHARSLSRFPALPDPAGGGALLVWGLDHGHLLFPRRRSDLATLQHLLRAARARHDARIAHPRRLEELFPAERAAAPASAESPANLRQHRRARPLPVATKDAFISRIFFFNFVPWLYVALLFSHHYLPAFLARGIFKGDAKRKRCSSGPRQKRRNCAVGCGAKAEIGLRTSVCLPTNHSSKPSEGIPVLGTSGQHRTA